jgi:hypothetical protein
MKQVELSLFGLMLAVTLTAAGCAHSDRDIQSPVDEPMRLDQESAQAAFSSGAYEEAATRFTEAIHRAFLRDDGRAVARYRYQLAACRIAQGRLVEGKRLMDSARVEALVAGDGLTAARAETAAARLALEQGNLEESQKLARLALSRPEARSSVRLAADIRLILAEGAVRGGDSIQAKAELAEVGRIWGRMPVDPAIQATSERVRGQIFVLTGNAKEAGKAFDNEGASWQEARRFADHAASLERAALAWQKAGDDYAAATRMYRSARIRTGLGQAEKAHLLAGIAAEWAEKAELIDLQECCKALMHETGKPAVP